MDCEHSTYKHTLVVRKLVDTQAPDTRDMTDNAALGAGSVDMGEAPAHLAVVQLRP